MRLDPIPGQTNSRFLDLVKRADGDPITSGTVNYYLQAVTGDNAGKWFKHSDQTWNVSETVCMAMAHVSRSHWKAADVHADGWIDGVEYLEYAKESGDLDVAVSNTFTCHYRPVIDADGHSEAVHGSGRALPRLGTSRKILRILERWEKSLPKPSSRRSSWR